MYTAFFPQPIKDTLVSVCGVVWMLGCQTMVAHFRDLKGHDLKYSIRTVLSEQPEGLPFHSNNLLMLTGALIIGINWEALCPRLRPDLSQVIPTHGYLW